MKLEASLTPAQISEMLRANPQLLTLVSPQDQIRLDADLARAFASAGDEDNRIAYDVAAIDLIEASRAQVPQVGELTDFFGRQISVYDDIIAALFAKSKRGGPVDSSLLRFGRTHAEIALYFSEAAHARQFSERYGPALMNAFGVLGGLPPDVRATERKLRAAVGAAANPTLVFTSPIITRLEVQQSTKAYIDFLDSIASAYPRFAALAFARPVQVATLPSSLRDQFIVVYKVTDSAVYWWLVHNGEVAGFDRLDITRRALREGVTQLSRYIDDDSLRASVGDPLVHGPFAQIATLAAQVPREPPRVIIVPDDVLYELPWDALFAPRGGYLGDSFITSYAPSLTVLTQAVAVDRPPVTQPSALVVTNAQERDVTISLDGKSPVNFPVLPADESRAVVAALKSRGYSVATLEGANATPNEIAARDQSIYAIVHFNTHAFAETLDPLPSLILHPSPYSPLGLLTLTDIPNLKLRARLVTLSACESALGENGAPVPGEGVETLARMFMIAGSKAVLASLQDVEAGATSALMEHFYQELSTTHSGVAAALFRAKLAVRKQGFRNPSSWARFILIGDPQS